MYRSPTRRLFSAALAACAMCLAPLVASAQDLTAPQLATVCTAVKANPAANAARIAGDTVALMAWLNGARAPAVAAWYTAAPVAAIEQAPSYTTYDALVAGKRDSWVMFLRNDRDFTRAKTRNWVVDIWGAATAASNAEAVLRAGTFSATNTQHALGGTTRTTGTVSALDLVYPSIAPQSTADWLVVSANCN